MKFIGTLIINIIALLVTAYLVPGFVVTSYQAAFVAAVVIGIINIFIKPVISLIALPITILTLGLFSGILNLAFLWIAAEITPGFDITTLTSLVIGSLVLSVVSSVLNMIR